MNLTNKKFRTDSNYFWTKREFDATSHQDLAAYQNFLLNKKWDNGCPFVLEEPFTNVPDMINNKILYEHIGFLVSNTK